LGNLPPEGADSAFWKSFSKTHNLTSIVFDEHVYNIKIAQGAAAGGVETIPVPEPIFGGAADTPFDMPMSDEDFDPYLSSFHDLIQELFHKGADNKVKSAVEQQFLGLPQRNLPTREKVIDIDRSLMEILHSAFQHAFARHLTDPLVDVFPQERDAKLMAEMAGLMNLMFTSLIGFVDYAPASRLITKLQDRHKALKKLKDPNAKQLGKSLELRLTPATQKLLLADLKSSEADRHNKAIQLLDSLGHIAVPLLINILKQEDDFRARQAAATILAKQGPQATDRLKQLMVLEILPEERVRLLENIDTVTTDLITELRHALGDENKEVRMAAFRLSERLKDAGVVDMLLENARKEKGEMAVAAVNALEKIRPPEAVADLSTIVKSTRDEALRVACCRALGRIAKPECIEPLANILGNRNRLLRRYRYSDQVRATAAFALGQIPQARAVKTLAAYVHDPDQRIRDVSRTVLRKVKAAALRRSKAAAAAT
jgi:HEAT repeat protein